MMSLDTWCSQINDYALDSTKPDAKAILKNTPEAIDALYKDTDNQVNITARTAFLTYLHNEVYTKLPKRDPINVEAIKIEDLLSKEGLKLYKAAIKEESRSKAFREAVLVNATKHYDGEAWEERMIMPLGGPSGAGKSVGADNAIEAMKAHMEKAKGGAPGAPPGNDVVFIDGGVEREVSQMRKMVLQVALAKGYKGIEDLHQNTELLVKYEIEKAVLKTPKLSMVVPDPFTLEVADYAKKVLSGGMAGGVALERFKEYKNTDNGNAIVVFGVVEAIKENVAKGGEKRAWNTEDYPDGKIGMNAKMPCESKNYEGKFFTAGEEMTREAQKSYLSLPGKKFIIEIKNDFTFIQYDNHQKQWVLADANAPWNGQMVGICKKDFNAIKDDLNKESNVNTPQGLNQWMTAQKIKRLSPEIYVNGESPYGYQKDQSAQSVPAVPKRNLTQGVQGWAEDHPRTAIAAGAGAALVTTAVILMALPVLAVIAAGLFVMGAAVIGGIALKRKMENTHDQPINIPPKSIENLALKEEQREAALLLKEEALFEAKMKKMQTHDDKLVSVSEEKMLFEFDDSKEDVKKEFKKVEKQIIEKPTVEVEPQKKHPTNKK